MADLTNRLAGTAFLSVDGVTYQLEGELAYSPVELTRETLAGQDGVHGFSEKPTPGVIEANIRDSGGLVVADFNIMRNVTIVAELANGKTVTGRNMWSVGEIKVETVDAKFAIRWEGFNGCVVEGL